LHPVQVLKSHLRLIRGSMILDHIRTRFLGVRLIRESDLYASIYGTLVHCATVVIVNVVSFAMAVLEQNG